VVIAEWSYISPHFIRVMNLISRVVFLLWSLNHALLFIRWTYLAPYSTVVAECPGSLAVWNTRQLLLILILLLSIICFSFMFITYLYNSFNFEFYLFRWHLTIYCCSLYSFFPNVLGNAWCWSTWHDQGNSTKDFGLWKVSWGKPRLEWQSCSAADCCANKNWRPWVYEPLSVFSPYLSILSASLQACAVCIYIYIYIYI
jgi:hypothetical protein